MCLKPVAVKENKTASVSAKVGVCHFLQKVGGAAKIFKSNFTQVKAVPHIFEGKAT